VQRACLHPDCGELTEATYCPEHRPKAAKPSATQRGYDAQWVALSRRAIQPAAVVLGVRHP
jgi:hypothetical protein